MVFWRKKSNPSAHDEERRDEALLHPKGEPALELPTEHETDLDAPMKQRLSKSETQIIEDMDAIPVPAHTLIEDVTEAEDLKDHSEEGGWLSRLTSGLMKSSSKITQGLTDLVTKRKLDQDALDQLEEVLIAADLGPKTSAKIISEFSEGRFGKDISEEEIREALAAQMQGILEPVARPLDFTLPAGASGPFTVLVCGVNGAGKTTTIGKIAHKLKREQGKSVLIAAGDTFRAAAVEQLAEWAKRAGAGFLSKDLGADAAAVAFEAYQKAQDQGTDILLIDTAGRLQNKANLMEELKKIIRVLKKKDEALPHAVLLVLDATTGQNAFSQLKTFGEMVDVTGLIVTKLDGSAKGGVLVGLADQFNVPVHLIGVGEAIEDLQGFTAQAYARSLMGLE